MSAPSPDRPEVTPPRTPRCATGPSEPAAATSAALTDGDAVDSAVAMATVPISTASTGMSMRVASGPAPVEQLGRPARRADATSDGQGDVRSPTDVVVGGDQHLLEVAPGVVASGQSALEVQPDPVLGGVRDVEHPAHAVLVAGLER